MCIHSNSNEEMVPRNKWFMKGVKRLKSGARLKGMTAVLLAGLLLTGCGGEEDESVDIDMTVMSATMVYSEIFNMMLEPESYAGKTIKLDGWFSGYEDPSNGKVYTMCVVPDATACCSEGIEFVLADSGKLSYPEDYPEAEEDITIIGVYDAVGEEEDAYYVLQDAVFTE